MTTNYEEIRYKRADGMATLIINRTQQLNVLTNITLTSPPRLLERNRAVRPNTESESVLMKLSEAYGVTALANYKAEEYLRR